MRVLIVLTSGKSIELSLMSTTAVLVDFLVLDHSADHLLGAQKTFAPLGLER